MFRPLFYLSLLVALTGADAGGSGAPKSFSLPHTYNFSSCPLNFYGIKYTSFTAEKFGSTIRFCFGLNCTDAMTDNDGSGDTGVTFQTGQPDDDLDKAIKEKMSTNEEQMKCFLKMTYSTHKGSWNTFFFVQYETRSFVGVQNSATKPDDSLDNAPSLDVVLDMSGCRTEADVFISPGEEEYDDDTCVTYSCSSESVLSVKGCPENHHCDGNGTCIPYRICTLTGPTVINGDGDVTTVEDRCTYTLMSDNDLVSEFEVLASYKDRRRTDVSFLDSVTLKNGVEVLLEQGGTVKVDGSAVELTSSLQDHGDGVKLSKTEAGVFAKLKLNDSVEVTVFFDGNTAQLKTTSGFGYYPPGGLCGDDDKASSTNQTASGSCWNMPTETSNLPVDCDAIKERCNILMKEPFSSCHATVNPAPYITACSDTVCQYPDEDGLMCQFLEAYARACSLVNIQLEEWRSNQKCSTSQIVCESPCSDNEFCGLVSGSPTCLCRSIFASAYRSSNNLGDPTVCIGDSASLTLVGCLLAEKGIDYSTLHLNNKTCTGVMDDESHMVTFSFDNDNCGTLVEKEESKVSYKNTIQTTSSSSSSVITRHNEVKIDFSCIHVEPKIKTMSFTIKDSSVSQEVTSEVASSFTVTMSAYTDAEHTQAVDSDTEVLLDQKIWVELTSDGLDENLVAMVIDSCWATGQEASDSDVKYDLIKDGCANKDDSTVQVEGNGEGTSSYFSFSMFEFTGSSSAVYLHCQIHLCVKDNNNNCLPDCSGGGSGRKRRFALSRSRYGRSARRAVAPAFISMAWTK
ncbi:pancreatic secretory granule membrane major glycoprotein GP2-like [Cololabis saira]|uniref:pancreatic secretory granule membrane major glycoprotein GP2-like n=1 Tax=Cololabis saira TaxID=129043 RepID=UPI002AD223FA|nr:pancreatic secretory granule membrane major glycoprotein GP2-like [Cololabis saira]XP_061598354.1 pancreatic secretory granule membrane major glycoprotein GP2-like [Cololabis saira]XP_061598355.1 pancreatic secretory granule membrane major glycoprotein GP2-like [Cololabis saira]